MTTAGSGKSKEETTAQDPGVELEKVGMGAVSAKGGQGRLSEKLMSEHRSQ